MTAPPTDETWLQKLEALASNPYHVVTPGGIAMFQWRLALSMWDELVSVVAAAQATDEAGECPEHFGPQGHAFGSCQVCTEAGQKALMAFGDVVAALANLRRVMEGEK